MFSRLFYQINVRVPNKTEDLKLSMITGINELKTLTEHILCECNCELLKENLIQISSGIAINDDVSVKRS